MTTINSISRQPTQQDYASPSQFKFSIAKLPKVEFFCTEVNIPGINLGNAVQLTTLKDIPLPGTKLEFGDLSLTFLVDEIFSFSLRKSLFCSVRFLILSLEVINWLEVEVI